MKKIATGTSSAQAGASVSRDTLMQLLRDSLRTVAEQMLVEEVDALCGESHRPRVGTVYRRAGSEKGTCYAEGQRQTIVRPRVRRKHEDGTEREHLLASYAAMREPGNNAAAVVKALAGGMSTRSQAWAMDGVMSKTAASRHWVQATAAKIGELRERDLRGKTFFAVMLDGVAISQGAMVVIALGLTTTGEKLVLDFEVGASENAPVCKALVTRLQRRGFGPAAGHRLFAVLDGSDALEVAVRAAWPDACIQRCLIHKERNLYGYLRKGDHAEAARLWKRLRQAQGEDAGREALAAIRSFLRPLNAAAMASLDEAGESLIALHRLDVPATLNVSLLSTNPIENVIRNYRRHTNKVTRWRIETDQISRWTATALLQAETGFRRIKGYTELPRLLAALAKPGPSK